MTLKTHEELVVGDPPSRDGSMHSPGRSEFAIEGTGTPLEGSMAASIDGGSTPSLAGPDSSQRFADDSNQNPPRAHERVDAGISLPANSNRFSPVRARLDGGEPARRELGSERGDPEKVRLVAEINAVWKRLEAIEDKRLRLREEVDELRLSLSEEQRARSTATRELRLAEEREARAVGEVEDLKESCEALRGELEHAKQSLVVQRWEFLAKGAAAASGILGVAAILTRALVSRANPSALLRLPALIG
jgi:hypothetical protein